MPTLTQKLTKPLVDITVLVWDFNLFLLNLVLPPHPPDSVVPTNAPGFHGHWGTYVPPGPNDSRSACPMLNALANHSILPHDGKNISFRTLNTTVRESFNFAPSFCFFVPNFAANFLSRSYWTGTFDLADLSKHNAIEHDASLTRRDVNEVSDQGVPDLGLVDELLGGATGEGGTRLTKEDLSRALAKRRKECREGNQSYSESLFHNGFGSANSSTMLTIFGGSVDDLRPMLREERFVEGWQPRIRSRFGLTMAAFNGTVLPVEMGVKRAKIE
ncbi:hypothetical protein ACEQ8H_008435 [Pleosporales sp. CAS-2024a]